MKGLMTFALICIITAAAAQQNPLTRVLVPVKIDGKWGYIDTSGNLAIEAKYDRASRFSTNERSVARVTSGQNAYVINKAGQVIFDPEYYDFKLLNDSVFIYYSGGHWGLFDYKKNIRTDPIFYSVKALNTNPVSYIVTRATGRGMMDHKLRLVLPCVYAEIERSGDMLNVLENGKYGLLTWQGEEIFPAEYDQIRRLNKTLFWTKKRGLSGVTKLSPDGTGDMLLELDTTAVLDSLDDHYAVVHYGDLPQLDVLELATMKVLRTEFDRIQVIDGIRGKFKVFKRGACGIWDPQKGTILEPGYTDVRWLEPYFNVLNDGYWHLHSSDGVRLNEAGFDRFQINDNGIFAFRHTKVGLLDHQGKELIPTVFSYIWWHENIYKCKENNMVVLYEIRDGAVWDRISLNSMTSARNLGRNSSVPSWSGVASASPKRSGSWFFDPKTRRWGLKRPDGSVAIKPQFNDVNTVPGTSYAITERTHDQNVHISHHVVGYRRDGFTTYGVVDESICRQVCAPVYLNIDERTLVAQDLDVIRVRRTDGMFTTIDKRTGKVGVPAYPYMDTFCNGYARTMLYGQLVPGKKKYSVHYENTIGGDRDLLAGWGLNYIRREFNTIRPGEERIWYTKKAIWGYINSQGKAVRARTDEALVPKREYPLEITEGLTFYKNYVPVRFEGLWYLMNGTGYFPPEQGYSAIDQLDIMDERHYMVRYSKHTVGALDLNGNVIDKTDYRSIRPFREQVAWAVRGDTCGLLRSGGEWIPLPGPVRKMVDFNNGYGAYRERNFWVFVNAQGDTMHAGRVRNTSGFSEGLAAVKVLNDKNKVRYGYIDTHFKMVIPPDIEKAHPFSCDRARIYHRGRHSFIDRTGKRITRKKFTRARDFNNGLALVQQKKGWGLLDVEGNIRVPAKYSHITREDSYIHAFNQGIIDVYDAEGQLIKQISDISRMYGFSDGLNRVAIKRSTGYLNPDGSWKVRPVYRYAGDFSEGFAMICSDDTSYSINKNLDTVGSVPFLLMGRFENKIIRHMSSDHEGNTIVRYLDNRLRDIAGDNYFENGTPFSYGLAAVQVEGKWGMIDTTGHYVVTPLYAAIDHWDENHIRIRAGYLAGIIDHSGNVVVPVAYNEISILEPEQVIWVSQGSFCGYMNMQGAWIWRSDLYGAIGKE